MFEFENRTGWAEYRGSERNGHFGVLQHYPPYIDIALRLRHRFRLAAKGTADLADRFGIGELGSYYLRYAIRLRRTAITAA
jgi:hypothetical protein